MQILETIIPVFLLIAIGFFLKKGNLLTDAGIASIKKLAVNIFLPVTAFNVLINGNITKESFLLMGMIIVILFAAWGLGHLYKRFFDEKIRDYIPFITTAFEGGMFGWALISILVGPQNLFLIIPMDVTNGVFGFTFMTTCLKILGGQKMTKKETALSVVTNPLVIAVVLGFIGSMCGLGKIITDSAFAGTYNKCNSFLTEPLSPLILICIGAGLSFEKSTLLAGLKAALLRIATLIVVVGLSLLVLYQISAPSPVLLVSLLVYFAVPSSFILPMYTNDEDVNKFMSSVLSIEIVFSLIIFSVISILVPLGVFGTVQM